MGYRSDVQAVIYPITEGNEAQYNQLKVLMNTAYKEAFDHWVDEFEWDDDKLVLKFSAVGVKWYSSYTDVVQIEALLSGVEELGYAVEFVRLGEDYNDIETRYSEDCSFYLSVRREILSDV